MDRVNYGFPVIFITQRVDINGQAATMVTAIHEGSDGHKYLEDGEQCECGVMKIGVRE
jgi:hypothetical protein